jgi:hypothetical protein
LQEFIPSIMMDDGFTQDCTKRGHAFGQPQRNTPAMKWKISAACPSSHWIESDLLGTLTQMEAGMPGVMTPGRAMRLRQFAGKSCRHGTNTKCDA